MINLSMKKTFYNKTTLTHSIYYLLPLLILFFCYQSQVFAISPPSEKPTKIITSSPLPSFAIDPSKTVKLSSSQQHIFNQIAPTAIPAGTSISNVSFFGIDTSSSVVVSADTNGDRVPDVNDTFITSDDPANEITTAMTISKTTGKIYIGVVAADGPNKQMGQIIITDNAKQDFHATKQSSFSIGKGTPLGLTTISSPKGDILVVATLFFAQDLFDITDQDSYTIVAYLPNSDGIVDGKTKVNILAPNSTLGTRIINFGFGALATDAKGNLYANVAAKFKLANILQFTGAIAVFTDTNNDLIPDKVSVFVSPSSVDLNPATASSIVPTINAKGENQFFVYGINDVFNKPSQIIIYTDLDNDLKADKTTNIFFTGSPQLQGIVGAFGKGTSAITTSRLAYSDGEALFSFASFDNTGNKVIDGGVALLRDNGTGTTSKATQVFSAPKTDQTVSIITFVVGVPGSNDKTPPVVKILNPSSGDKLSSGSPFTINFSSSDDTGVISYNILLAVNGNTFNPLVIGLAGNMNSFKFTVPNMASTMAAIRVQALDSAGNIGAATVDNLTIETDTISPTVIVASPKDKDKLKGNTMFTITFKSSDDRGVVSHEFLFSPDNGNNFVSFAKNIPGNVQSLTIPVPNMKVKQGLIKIIARDAAGNQGEGFSGVFKIKPSK